MELATRAIFGGEQGGMEIKQIYDPNEFEDPGIVKRDEIQLYRYVSEKLMMIFLFYTAMQLHCATLEALALDKPMVERIVDTTKPNVDMINQVFVL